MRFECAGSVRIEQRTNGLGNLYASVATAYEGYCGTIRLSEGVAVLASPANSNERLILLAPSSRWIKDLEMQGWTVHETLIEKE